MKSENHTAKRADNRCNPVTLILSANSKQNGSSDSNWTGEGVQWQSSFGIWLDTGLASQSVEVLVRKDTTENKRSPAPQ